MFFKRFFNRKKISRNKKTAQKTHSVARLLVNQQVNPKHRKQKITRQPKKLDFGFQLIFMLHLLLVGLIISGSWYYFKQPLIMIVAKNTSPYSSEELNSGIINQSFSSFDSHLASKNIARLPWIKEVKLKKKPPQLLKLIVEGRVKTALLQIGSELILIDNQASSLQKIIPSEFKAYEQLPLIKLDKSLVGELKLGVKINLLNITWALNWLEEFKNLDKLESNKILYVDANNPYQLIIRYNKTDFIVAYDQRELQLKNLEDYLGQIDLTKPNSIDLRFPGRVIIKK